MGKDGSRAGESGERLRGQKKAKGAVKREEERG